MERLTIPDVKIDEKTTKRAFVDGDTVRAAYRKSRTLENADKLLQAIDGDVRSKEGGEQE